ncbi:hypothetical protein EXW94_19335 [Enterobacter sp. JMULE2]|uniref:hypothetical protein n=1 Tax=Enterobacter sp. JMULE2 TaxID=2518340 RepID=UPI0015750811|nr:hypothetical protein [Enterobacter sp. JMULE2]NTZ39814.1 hypothetical protein [Enterobacter sp. JMULE2]
MRKTALIFSLLILSACHSESDNQKILKSQVYESIDSTRTLGAALDNRQRCTSVDWQDSVDDKGRQTVIYTCSMKGDESEQVWTQHMEYYINSNELSLKNEKYRADVYTQKCKQQYPDRDCTPSWIAGLQIPKIEQSIEQVKKIVHTKINDVKNIYIWSVVPGNEQPVTLLSMRYEYTFSDGKTHSIFWRGRAIDAIRDDIYRDRFTLANTLAQKEINNTECRVYKNNERCNNSL